jgi:hypothetical protein
MLICGLNYPEVGGVYTITIQQKNTRSGHGNNVSLCICREHGEKGNRAWGWKSTLVLKEFFFTVPFGQKHQWYHYSPE